MADVAAVNVPERSLFERVARVPSLLNQGVESMVAGTLSLPALVADGYLNIYRSARQAVGGRAFEASDLYERSKASITNAGRTMDGTKGKVIEAETNIEKNIVFGAELVTGLAGPGALKSVKTLSEGFSVAKGATTAAKVETAASATATAAKATSWNPLTKSPTYGGMLATHAVIGAGGFATYTGLKVYEHESGGAASTAVFDGTVSFLKEQIAKGISVKDIERKMETLDYIMAVNGAFNKSAQNLYVRGVMNNNEGPDAIKHGQMAAISTQFLPHNAAILFAKHEVRSAIADDMHPGNKDAANKYLAESLVDDIVKNAQVNSLEGNQVSHDDVRKVLTDVMQNPERHPVASKFFTERGRVTNGLKQIWPELTQTPAPSANATTTLGGLGAAASAVFSNASGKAGDAVENITDSIDEHMPEGMKEVWGQVSGMAKNNPYFAVGMSLGMAYGAMGAGKSRTERAMGAAMYGALFGFAFQILGQLYPGLMPGLMKMAGAAPDALAKVPGAIGLNTSSLNSNFKAAAEGSATAPTSAPAQDTARTPVAAKFEQASSGKPAPAPAPTPEDVDLRRNRPEAANNASYRMTIGAPA